MASAIVIFGFSSLRYPQYFALILVPMYAWFWTESRNWRLGARGRALLIRWRVSPESARSSAG